MSNRAGTLVTNLSGDMAYQSFRPTPLPPIPPIELSNELVTKLIDSNKKLATDFFRINCGLFFRSLPTVFSFFLFLPGKVFHAFTSSKNCAPSTSGIWLPSIDASK